MNTKAILKILGKTLISLFLVLSVIFIVGIVMMGINSIGNTSEKIISNFSKALSFAGPYLFLTLVSFYSIDYWMVEKEKTKNILAYFSSTILIPTIIGGISIVITLVIKNGNFSFTYAGYIASMNTIISTAVVLFFSIFHFLKHNTKECKRKNKKILWNSISMMKSVVLYAFILSIINLIVLMTAFYFFNFDHLFEGFVRDIIIAITCWFLVRFFNQKLETKLDFPILIIASIIAIVLLMQIILPVLNFIEIIIFHNDFLEKFLNGFTLANMFKLNAITSVYVIFCVLFYQFLYFNQTRVAEQKTFKAAIGKQTEKYESLRRQLSPHFLFNNINVLTALIEESPKKAIHFSESLGNIYRHFLQQEDEDVVSLESALLFSKDYLELLKYRYEEGFHYSLPEAVDLNYYIIPLALQQVIENTIKHNEVSIEKPLLLTIGIQDDYLIVQNTKQLKTQVETTKKTGIENIQKRYAFLTEKRVIVEDSTTTFTIKLPLLNMENS